MKQRLIILTKYAVVFPRALHHTVPVISRGGSRSCSRAAAGGGSLSDVSGPVKCCVTGARRRWGARSSEHRSPRGAWGQNETRAQSSPSRERSCPTSSPTAAITATRRKVTLRRTPCVCAVTACGFWQSMRVYIRFSLSHSLFWF